MSLTVTEKAMLGRGLRSADAVILALEDRIARAATILAAAPDPHLHTRAETQAIADANQRAWVVLMEGRDPVSQRAGESR